MSAGFGAEEPLSQETSNGTPRHCRRSDPCHHRATTLSKPNWRWCTPTPTSRQTRCLVPLRRAALCGHAVLRVALSVPDRPIDRVPHREHGHQAALPELEVPQRVIGVLPAPGRTPLARRVAPARWTARRQGCPSAGLLLPRGDQRKWSGTTAPFGTPSRPAAAARLRLPGISQLAAMLITVVAHHCRCSSLSLSVTQGDWRSG